jgi:hypothetical protein
MGPREHGSSLRLVTRRRLFVGAVGVGLGVAGTALPASATIHEIAQSECAAPAADFTTADLQAPPGLTGGSSADNFAQPLESLASNGRLVGSGVFVEPFPGAGFEIEILISNPDRPGTGPASGTGEAHCTNPETNAHPDAPGEVVP